MRYKHCSAVLHKNSLIMTLCRPTNSNTVSILLKNKLQGGKNKLKKDKSQAIHGLKVKYKKYIKL